MRVLIPMKRKAALFQPSGMTCTCRTSVLGIDTWALLGYGKKTIETTVQGLQVTMTALQRGCEQGLETISELMAKYRGVFLMLWLYVKEMGPNGLLG